MSKTQIRPIVVGNWKMNGLRAQVTELEALIGKLTGGEVCDVAICPPATVLMLMAETARGTAVGIGGQDCHAAKSGAHTGDLSAQMLKDAGATCVIVGHSERRTDHGETDAAVRDKAAAALAEGLTAIVCIGETEAERDADRTIDVLKRQLAGSLADDFALDRLIVAYEPVWAIGTGRTPTIGQISDAHAFIRETLAARFGESGKSVRLLYGGSVKPGNAAEIFAVADVDGGLIGGASLKADDFYAIVSAVPA